MTVPNAKNVFLGNYLFVFLALSISALSLQSFSWPFSIFQSSEDRAKVLHYKASKLKESGKTKRAIKTLKKAVTLDNKREYLIDLAELYLIKEEHEKAYQYINQITTSRSDSPMDEVKIASWKGIYALNTGLHEAPRKNFRKALDLLDLYQIENQALRSTLNCNLAVARIFDQSKAGDSFDKIHRKDFVQSKYYLQKALELNPFNCVAAHNLDVVDQVLSIPDQWLDYGYLKKHHFATLPIPEFDCEPTITIPEPTPNLTLEEDLQQKDEVLFVLDISGSMKLRIPELRKSRFQLMIEKVTTLIEELGPNVRIGVLTLGQTCNDEPILSIPPGMKSHIELIRLIQSLEPTGDTPLNHRLDLAAQLFSPHYGRKAIFLATDGIESCNYEQSTCDIGERLRRKGLQLHAYSLLLETPENAKEYAIYDCLTKATNGQLLGVSQEAIKETKATMAAIEPTDMNTDIFSVPISGQDLRAAKFSPYVPKQNPNYSKGLKNLSEATASIR